ADAVQSACLFYGQMNDARLCLGDPFRRQIINEAADLAGLLAEQEPCDIFRRRFSLVQHVPEYIVVELSSKGGKTVVGRFPCVEFFHASPVADEVAHIVAEWGIDFVYCLLPGALDRREAL